MIARAFYLFWIVVSAGLFYSSYDIPSVQYGFTGPETFPRALSFILLIMSVMLFIGSIRRVEDYEKKLLLNSRQAIMLIGFIIYVVMIRVLGYVIATPIYTTVTIILLEPNKSISQAGKALATALVSVGIIYYVFAVQLKVFLPAAIWE